MEYTRLLYEAYGYQLTESIDEQIQRLLRKLRAKQINDREMTRLVNLTLRTGKRVEVRFALAELYITRVESRLPSGVHFYPIDRDNPEDIRGKHVYMLARVKTNDRDGQWWTLKELYQSKGIKRFEVVDV